MDAVFDTKIRVKVYGKHAISFLNVTLLNHGAWTEVLGWISVYLPIKLVSFPKQRIKWLSNSLPVGWSCRHSKRSYHLEDHKNANTAIVIILIIIDPLITPPYLSPASHATVPSKRSHRQKVNLKEFNLEGSCSCISEGILEEVRLRFGVESFWSNKEHEADNLSWLSVTEG